MIKALTINKTSILQFGVLLAVATFAPLIGSQSITGPIVNAVLFISAVVLGSSNAMMIGMFPSLIAISTGLLSSALMPAIPFIIVSNAMLVAVFDRLRKTNFALAVIGASIIKFLFLFLSSSIVVNFVAKEQVAEKISAMLSWPQLFTALAGGLIAYIILKRIMKNDTLCNDKQK